MYTSITLSSEYSLYQLIKFKKVREESSLKNIKVIKK